MASGRRLLHICLHASLLFLAGRVLEPGDRKGSSVDVFIAVGDPCRPGMPELPSLDQLGACRRGESL
jgi:hypothetical protein